jgi:hypothetical protein
MMSTRIIKCNIAKLIPTEPMQRIAWIEKHGPAPSDERLIALVADAALWVRCGERIATDGSVVPIVRGYDFVQECGLEHDHVTTILSAIVANTGTLPESVDVSAALTKVCAEIEGRKLAEQKREADRLVADALRAKREEEAAAKKSAAASEQAAWIRAHGSPRLRRCLAEKIECTASYRDERLAAARPGWRWYSNVRGEFAAPRNPPEETFAMLDAARKTAPDAILSFFVAEAECDSDGDEVIPEWRGYVAAADFLGAEIVLGGPA